ncbi:TPA: hypothetical protein DCZ39_01955, partial [Patescibacteria group bacterium]|nr:hypothetical protein [Candidatus Gracilibacteria bacterium]
EFYKELDLLHTGACPARREVNAKSQSPKEKNIFLKKQTCIRACLFFYIKLFYNLLLSARAKKYENPNPIQAITTISPMNTPRTKRILLNILQSVTLKRLYT